MVNIIEQIKSLYGPEMDFFVAATNVLDGKWLNVEDGSNVTYFNWKDGEPNLDNPPHGVNIDSDGLWSTYPAYKYSNQFICGVPEE